MTGNRLAQETSPYLLQHARNPVDWHSWGREALDRAQAEDKPILLSIGYAACHWCHVMAHESFENPDIAAVMNRLFVNIKVDREERPDLDSLYQTALALMGQHGGWPLTMFLTPAGEPFWGGTYFPADAKYGRPGFPEVLDRVAELYHTRKEAVEQNRAALIDHMQQIFAAPRRGDLTPDLLDQAAAKLAGHVDAVHGGIGGAPKFPQPFALELLWRAHLRTGAPRLAEAVTRTLDHIAQGGIYDHLGGGFSRYSVDARWLVPHFEKMLYDNAQLVRLYTLVWQETRKPLYAERVAETMEWLMREMIAEDGGFAASLDADSEGVEGKFYVWTAEEVERLLGPEDFRLFADIYGLSPGGNWEGVNILNRLESMERLDPETEERLARCRHTLFRERETRIRPGWDDKVLTDWNGMMIAAAAQASRVFDREDWLSAARRAFHFVADRMVGEDGRLFHAYRAGRVTRVSLLDDHAHMILAALALEEATGDPDYLESAERWADAVEALFPDRAAGGYFTTAADAEGVILRSKSAHDTAQPSGNGALCEAYARLHHLSGDDRWRRAAEGLVETFGGEVERNFFPLAGLLNGYDMLVGAIEATLFSADDSGRHPLEPAYFGVSLPTGLLRRVNASRGLPESHAASGLDAAAGSAVVCARQSCSLAATDTRTLTAELRDRRGWRQAPPQT